LAKSRPGPRPEATVPGTEIATNGAPEGGRVRENAPPPKSAGADQAKADAADMTECALRRSVPSLLARVEWEASPASALWACPIRASKKPGHPEAEKAISQPRTNTAPRAGGRMPDIQRVIAIGGSAFG